MDRFIAEVVVRNDITDKNLKSNMDRFIVDACNEIAEHLNEFKIQYGQIYSESLMCVGMRSNEFKIQYGQIYRKGRIAINELITKFKIQYGQIYSRGIK